MEFWDASAIVPLLMIEATTRALQTLAADDPVMLGPRWPPAVHGEHVQDGRR
jgi:hypothetical protein